MRVPVLAAFLGLSLVFGAATAFAADVTGPPPTKSAGATAPQTVPLMTKGRKHAIIGGLIAAIFLLVGGAAGRNDKAGAGERIGPRTK